MYSVSIPVITLLRDGLWEGQKPLLSSSSSPIQTLSAETRVGTTLSLGRDQILHLPALLTRKIQWLRIQEYYMLIMARL